MKDESRLLKIINELETRTGEKLRAGESIQLIDYIKDNQERNFVWKNPKLIHYKDEINFGKMKLKINSDYEFNEEGNVFYDVELFDKNKSVLKFRKRVNSFVSSLDFELNYGNFDKKIIEKRISLFERLLGRDFEFDNKSLFNYIQKQREEENNSIGNLYESKIGEKLSKKVLEGNVELVRTILDEEFDKFKDNFTQNEINYAKLQKKGILNDVNYFDFWFDKEISLDEKMKRNPKLIKQGGTYPSKIYFDHKIAPLKEGKENIPLNILVANRKIYDSKSSCIERAETFSQIGFGGSNILVASQEDGRRLLKTGQIDLVITDWEENSDYSEIMGDQQIIRKDYTWDELGVPWGEINIKEIKAQLKK